MLKSRMVRILLLSVAMILLVGIVPVSAQEIESGLKLHSSGFTYVFNEEQQELVRQNLGAEMTMIDFWENIDPDVLNTLPTEVIERWRERPYIWYNKAQAEDLITNSQMPSSVNLWSDQTVYTTKIDFESGNQVTLGPRMPFMDVMTELWYRPDGSYERLVAADYKFGFNTLRVCASNTYYYPEAGYYQVIGKHYVEFPPNTVPPSAYRITNAGPTWHPGQ